MTDYYKDIDEVMDILKSISGVTNHLKLEQVQLGKEITQKRLELGWTIEELVSKCNKEGIPVSKKILSDMEKGDLDIDCDIYKRVINLIEAVK